jgi:hypothetical protein
LAFVAFTVKV